MCVCVGGGGGCLCVGATDPKIMFEEKNPAATL